MREVKPTQKPVPSSDIKDLFHNSGLLDIWATSLEHKYIDRFGNCHLTAAGMEWIFSELVTKFKIESEQALLAAGYAPAGTFQEGAKVVSRNGTVLWKLPDGDGNHYRWDGDLPKPAPAGSTPQSTGGIGKGAWVSVGDVSLRGDLQVNTGLMSVGGCGSMNELRAISGKKDGDQVFLKSYHAGKNKGGDIFRWDANSVDADDGGCTIKPDGVVAGRWVRVEHDRYTPEMYGADGTKENDPDAIERLLLNQKRVLFTGVYYYDREFVTNGHDVEGGTTGEFWGNGAASKIIFFGGFNSPQAVRNEITKSSYRNMTFEPESWDVTNGYAGTGLRIGRAIDAECCNWFKFKQFGMDLWASITEELVHYPYGSQFRNCKWDYNGWAGIRLTNGCNSIQIYGGSSGFNGATAYGVAPVDDSSGWDGILVGKVEEVGIPPMNNDFDLQGNIIEGIDCSYNARYGFNAYYANQSIFNVGYAEDNKGGADIFISDVVACDVNVLVSQQGPKIEVPEKGFGVTRSSANYPNRIIVNGQFYGGGSKDSFNRFINYQNGKFATNVLSVGRAGQSGIRSWHENDGSFETYAAGALALIRANAGDNVPPPSEKMLGTIWRDTSVRPNSVWMCIKDANDEYAWSQLNK